MPDEPNVPPGYAKCTVEGSYGPATWENVLWLGVTDDAGNPPLTQAQDIGQQVASLYSLFDAGDLSDQWSVSTVKVLLRPTEGDMVKSVTVADATGTNSNDSEAAQVAYLLNWVTSDYRRGGKARTYICGVPSEKMADSANVNPDTVSNFNGAIATWLGNLATGEGSDNGTLLELVEMSLVDAGVERDTPLGFPVAGGVCNGIVATQRRRVDRLR